jgi:hypothetical protein
MLPYGFLGKLVKLKAVSTIPTSLIVLLLEPHIVLEISSFRFVLLQKLHS